MTVRVKVPTVGLLSPPDLRPHDRLCQAYNCELAVSSKLLFLTDPPPKKKLFVNLNETSLSAFGL